MKKLVITDWSTLSMTDDLSTAALQELADVTAYPLTAPEEAAARIDDTHHRSGFGCLPKLGIYRRNGNRIQQY